MKQILFIPKLITKCYFHPNLIWAECFQFHRLKSSVLHSICYLLDRRYSLRLDFSLVITLSLEFIEAQDCSSPYNTREYFGKVRPC